MIYLLFHCSCLGGFGYATSYRSEGVAVATDGDTMQALYFRVDDFNLAAGKKTRVQLYYADPDGENMTINSSIVKAKPIDITQVYTVGDNAAETAVPNANLQSGMRYKVYLPQNILSAFADRDAASLEVYIQAITEISGGMQIGDDTLTLHKAGCFRRADRKTKAGERAFAGRCAGMPRG